MKKLLLLFISFFGFFFDACQEETVHPNVINQNYVGGEVVVGLNKTQSFEEFLDVILRLGDFKSIEVVNMNYNSYLPPDKKNFINDVLAHYTFIENSTTMKFDEEKGSWNIEFWISGFTKNNINDWKEIVRKLKLKHVPNNYQSILLRIAPGKEKEWIEKLNGLQIFRYVELNYIMRSF